MGWAISKRNCRRLTNAQKNFWNKLFDEGEKNGCKETPKDYLPISTIKSYFSRRAKNIRIGKIVADKEDKEKESDEEESDEEESDEDSDENEEAVSKTIC